VKYVLYARKSSEDKKRQVQSIDDQIDVMEKLASSRGMKIVEIVKDEKSAKAPGRPGFTRLLKILQMGMADGILCWKADRLSRNPSDSGAIAWLLQQGTILEIVTPERKFLPEDNSLLLSVEFGMATQYSRDLQKNVLRGMESKVDKGWMPTKAPIGYRNEVSAIKGQKRILPDKKDFPIIEGLWRKLLRDHCTLMQLYEYMKEHTPIYRGGKIIAFSSFDHIFKNNFYCGLFQWGGETRVGKQKPMITQQEFEEAQSILTGTNKLRQKGLQFDLKGLFHCGCCDALITAEKHTKTIKKTQEAKTFNYYRCAHRKGDKTCTEKPMSESAIEDFILHTIDQFSLPDSIFQFGLEKLKTQLDNPFSESVKERHLSTEIQTLKNRITEIKKNIAEERDGETRAIIKERINELQVQLQAREQELKKERDSWFNPHEEIANNIELRIASRKRFLEGTPDQKKHVVRGLGSNWNIHGQTLHYKPHFVSVAIEKVKELHSAELAMFEPTKNGEEMPRNVPAELMSTIWSG